MRNNFGLSSFVLAAAGLASISAASAIARTNHAAAGVVKRATNSTAIAPKVVIVNMFEPEGAAFWGIPEFDVLAQNITVPGLSPLFPEVHCTADGEVCQVITGEAEINAASTISAFVLSPLFDLTKSYFMIGGIAGVNPEVGTLGSVGFARYAVQVALQYEIDMRDLPDNFTTGYIPFGDYDPGEYPTSIYGTEVFELNLALRDIAISLASSATLNDSTDAQVYRALYAQDSAYAAGSKAPSVVGCDVATSDVWFSGDQLSSAFANTTKLWTNGTGLYCTTAEEDNASLEAILRAASANLTDYSRVILFRTASDFDRPPPGVSNLQNLLYTNQGGFSPAIANIYLAGVKVVSGILEGWNSTFADGITPSNYVGDIFNTLGGDPNFGLAADYITPASNTTSSSKHKRGVFSSANQPQGNRRMKRAAAQGAKKHAALARKRTVRT